MLQRARELLQTAILAGVRGVGPTDTQADISEKAGVERSLVSKWGSGSREMGLGDVVALAKAYGAVAVLGPIAALSGCDVVPRAGAVTACPRLGAVNVVVGAAELNALVNLVMADGRVSREEEAAIAAKMAELVAMVHGVGSAARKAS